MCCCYWKHFKLSCLVTNNITTNGNTINYCYPNANMETSQGIQNITPEDKILIRNKLLKGELAVKTEYVPIRKYRLDEGNEIRVLYDNMDEASHEEFSHHNLDHIKKLSNRIIWFTWTTN